MVGVSPKSNIKIQRETEFHPKWLVNNILGCIHHAPSSRVVGTALKAASICVNTLMEMAYALWVGGGLKIEEMAITFTWTT